jgi:hypothetical protein
MGKPSPLKVCCYVSVFFSVGVAIAVAAANLAIAKRVNLFTAVSIGAYTGGWGAYALCFFPPRFLRWLTSLSVRQFSRKQLVESATYVATGFGALVISFQQITSEAIAIPLFLLGGTLVGAGAFRPFSRTFSGGLIGLALCLFLFASM